MFEVTWSGYRLSFCNVGRKNTEDSLTYICAIKLDMKSLSH